ncbi:MAG: hypothetical protein GW858_13355 [Sphingomonadales bacterium]|nr:hypothetical protein [Sphingomonadales bacterium]NCQ22144.1 hypothetical protein [Sphingomonadales bacterium]NCT03373.1 hypothetical protein [Sphingomonadales bacterium]
MTRAVILALCLLAAGCSDDPASTAEQGAAASGEVLEGSISDAMIPLDQLESQAPLAPRQAAPVGDIDAEQPNVTPVPGIDTPVTSEGAETAPAAPAPETEE